MSRFYYHIASKLDLGGDNGVHQLGGRLLAVALRVVVGPAPEILARALHGQLRLPVELLVGEGRVGRQIQHITLAAGNHLVGQIAADSLGEGLDDVEDGAAAAGAKVPGLDTGLVLAQVLQGGEMAAGEVENVDVVADGGSVLRGVV